ncbi:lysozyme inhibitor LprI family protein [Virgibacillus doumboii]|uniref:lysozyme inhibitor LprI family protein n=1 Tax=Virgibacillus doumboii TaxID=2697503 RepID=UPI001FECFEAE|nr:lysozyme inhibitor LprI family protein [Virgibacillus doumboii]
MVMLTVVVILAACGNSSDESGAKSNNQSSNSSSTQSENGDSSNKNITNGDKTENSSEGAENTQLNDQDSNNTDAASNDEESKSGNNSEMTVSKKGEYLKKLNKMEEADRFSEAGTTISELEKQEAERYKKWDRELNEIYGVLKEQLSIEQMDKLREEQRDWIKHRDEVAKEASLKYKGGTTESLEYVATQASLTRERCYALVANYMK